MGKKVSNLVIKPQSGADNTYYASWDFIEPEVYEPSGSVKKGTLVSFVTSAPNLSTGIGYFTNGVKISDDIKKEKWYVANVNCNNALISNNESKTKTLNGTVKLTAISAGGLKPPAIPVKNVDHYVVKWDYATADGVWFQGGTSNVTSKVATYSPPSNAIKIQVSVRPVSKTYKQKVTVNKKETTVEKSYWTGTTVTKKYSLVPVPDTPSAPDVTIKQYKLTAKIENITDPKTDKVEFYILKNNKYCRAQTVSVLEARAICTTTVDAGGIYSVRCRAINIVGSNKQKIEGEWSEWTYDVKSAPDMHVLSNANDKQNITCRVTNKTSVYISWKKVAAADKYTIEYTTDKKYFETSQSNVNSVEVDGKYTSQEITGLGGSEDQLQGQRYWFRIKASNDGGDSKWTTGEYSVLFGVSPSAPTTWSSATVVSIGGILNLYWVHNSEDNSKQTHAQILMTVNGVEQKVISLDKFINKDDDNNCYPIDTTSYTEDTTIEWKIRTAGITGDFGDYSVTRSVKIYNTPELSIGVFDKDDETNTATEITSFPVGIRCSNRPESQHILGVSVSISAVRSHMSSNDLGEDKWIAEGENIFSKYYPGNTELSNELKIILSANDVTFEGGEEYTITCIASLDSGLTSTASASFGINWNDGVYEPEASVSIIKDTIAAVIYPFMVDDNYELNADVVLSVYRREFDGTFTEIETNVPNLRRAVVDPHPALDYARYRIVAKNTKSGLVSFYDCPGEPIQEEAIIIQWDEKWQTFSEDVGNQIDPVWSGSLLRLPYNIDVADTYNPDAELIEYTGRKKPVTYYGTQIGHTATWSTVIPYTDTETLYALRRLSQYMGDVYVREPSGSGYWANVKVSFTQTHCELTIPVTFNITRVEGGM